MGGDEKEGNIVVIGFREGIPDGIQNLGAVQVKFAGVGILPAIRTLDTVQYGFHQ